MLCCSVLLSGVLQYDVISCAALRCMGDDLASRRSEAYDNPVHRSAAHHTTGLQGSTSDHSTILCWQLRYALLSCVILMWSEHMG